MRFRPIFALTLILVFAVIALVTEWLYRKEGGPQIEASVRQEAALLARTDAEVQSLDLGRKTKTQMLGSGASMTGYFEFDGSYSNRQCDVFVSWRKADTNSPIDKIEIGIDNQELETIWTRK